MYIVNQLISNDIMIIKDDEPIHGPIWKSLRVERNNINVYQQYHWMSCGDELAKLKVTRPVEVIYYQGLMHYKSSIKFTIDVFEFM